MGLSKEALRDVASNQDIDPRSYLSYMDTPILERTGLKNKYILDSSATRDMTNRTEGMTGLRQTGG